MSNRRKLKGQVNGFPFLTRPQSSRLILRPGEDVVEYHDCPDRGAINVYRCDKCTKYRVVQHVDKGVTPMFMACAEKDCNGRGVSMMYPDQQNIPDKIRDAVRWEWYRPEVAEFKKLSPEMKDHVARGGLVIREKT